MNITIKKGDVIAKKDFFEPCYLVTDIQEEFYVLQIIDDERYVFIINKDVAGQVKKESKLVSFPKEMLINKEYFKKPDIICKYNILKTDADIKAFVKKNKDRKLAKTNNYYKFILAAKHRLIGPEE